MNKKDAYYHKESMAISAAWAAWAGFIVLSFFCLFATFDSAINNTLFATIVMCFAITGLLYLDWKGYYAIKERTKYLDAILGVKE